MIESVVEGDEGIDSKNYKELILFSKEGIQRLKDTERKYIEILRNLERKRYWGKKNIKKYYSVLLKKKS